MENDVIILYNGFQNLSDNFILTFTWNIILFYLRELNSVNWFNFNSSILIGRWIERVVKSWFKRTWIEALRAGDQISVLSKTTFLKGVRLRVGFCFEYILQLTKDQRGNLADWNWKTTPLHIQRDVCVCLLVCMCVRVFKSCLWHVNGIDGDMNSRTPVVKTTSVVVFMSPSHSASTKCIDRMSTPCRNN